jgi:hypothetical protein
MAQSQKQLAQRKYLFSSTKMDATLLNAAIENLRVAKRVPSSAATLIDVTLKLLVRLSTERKPLRFTCRDMAFDMFTNIACYRAMIDNEEHQDKDLPYGLRDTASVRRKIENYRDAYHVKHGLSEPSLDMWSTRTIRYLIEYAPTRGELDEAADYYKTRERAQPKTWWSPITKNKRIVIELPDSATVSLE